MPSLVIHLLVPPLVLLATRRFPHRLVLLLLPFSLLPDLDFFVPPHRALLHSAFLVGLLLAVSWRWRARAMGPRADAALVAAFYLGSHGLMDLFAGGVVPFWPLSDQTFFIDVQVLIDTRTLETFPTFEPGSQAGVPELAPVYEFLDGEQFAVLVLTLLVLGLVLAKRALTVKREVVVVSDEP